MKFLPALAWQVPVAVFRQLRRPARRVSIILKVAVLIFLIYIGEILIHAHTNSVTRPRQDLDQPFATRCQDPVLAALEPRENATFVMLARNSDIDRARETIENIERQFNKWFHYPVLFFNDEDWDPEFIRILNQSVSGQANFDVIPRTDWSFPEWVDAAEARQSMMSQDKSGVYNGGTESYHHMCRFYSGYR
jgi:mannosyltransferase